MKLNILMYKILFCIVSLLATISYTTIYGSQILKLLLIVGFLLIIYSLSKGFIKINNFNKKTILFFLSSIIISVFLNYQDNFVKNLTDFMYVSLQIITLYLICINHQKEDLDREMYYFSLILSIITFIFSLGSLILMFMDFQLPQYFIDYGYRIGFSEGRLWGLYGNPNTLAQISIFSVAASMICLKLSNQRCIKLFSSFNLIVQYIAISLTNSRSGYVSIIFLLTIFVFFYFEKKISRRIFLAIVSIVLTFVTLTATETIFMNLLNNKINSEIVVEENPNDYVETLENKSVVIPQDQKNSNEAISIERTNEKISAERTEIKDDISNGRFDIWKTSIQLFLEKPLGVGYYNVLNEMCLIAGDYNPILSNTHNIYLQILVAYGIISFIIFMVFLVCFGMIHLKKINQFKENDRVIYLTLFSLYLTFLINNLFDSNIIGLMSPIISCLFWIYVGYLSNFHCKNNKVKLGFVIETLNGGGAEKSLVTLLNNIDLDKYEIILYVLYNEGVYFNQIPSKVKIKKIIPLKSKIAYSFFIRYVKYTKCWLLRVFYINDELDTVVSYLEGVSTKIVSCIEETKKKITWIHTDISKDNYYLYPFRNSKDCSNKYNFFDYIVCVSEECMAKAKICLNEVENDKFFTCYNPINQEEIINKSNLNLEIELKPNVFNIVSVGRLIKEKGYSRLINSLSIARNEGYNNFHLYILGTGNEKENLINLINKLNLNEYVTLLGFKENPYVYIKKSDLFVCSSFNEGFSLVVAEALIIGTPVLSTKCVGPNELLKNGEYGLLVDNDDKKLTEKIIEVLDNKTILNKYKNQKLYTDLDINKIIKKIELLFK